MYALLGFFVMFIKENAHRINGEHHSLPLNIVLNSGCRRRRGCRSLWLKTVFLSLCSLHELIPDTRAGAWTQESGSVPDPVRRRDTFCNNGGKIPASSRLLPHENVHSSCRRISPSG